MAPATGQPWRTHHTSSLTTAAKLTQNRYGSDPGVVSASRVVFGQPSTRLAIAFRGLEGGLFALPDGITSSLLGQGQRGCTENC